MSPEREAEVKALQEIKEEIDSGVLATTDDVVDAIETKIEEIEHTNGEETINS